MRTYWLFLRFFLRTEFANKDKLLSSLLLGINVLVIFVFAFGEIESHTKQNAFFIAMLGIAMLFSSQAHLSRAWESETQDQALRALGAVGRASPKNFALFFSKFTASSGLLVFINLPLLILASVLLPHEFKFAELLKIALFMLLSVFGACGVGILLAALVTQARSKNLLFTLIFFPLLTPVLVCFVFGSLNLSVSDQSYWQWFQLLGLFDILYLSLGSALFCEIMEA